MTSRWQDLHSGTKNPPRPSSVRSIRLQGEEASSRCRNAVSSASGTAASPCPMVIGSANSRKVKPVLWVERESVHERAFFPPASQDFPLNSAFLGPSIPGLPGKFRPAPGTRRKGSEGAFDSRQRPGWRCSPPACQPGEGPFSPIWSPVLPPVLPAGPFPLPGGSFLPVAPAPAQRRAAAENLTAGDNAW